MMPGDGEVASLEACSAANLGAPTRRECSGITCAIGVIGSRSEAAWACAVGAARLQVVSRPGTPPDNRPTQPIAMTGPEEGEKFDVCATYQRIMQNKEVRYP